MRTKTWRKKAVYGIGAYLICSAALVPIAAPAHATGIYPDTRINLGCNQPWNQDPTGRPKSYGYNFSGEYWGYTGAVDSYTDITVNGEYRGRADEVWTVTATNWSSSTWYGIHPSGASVQLHTKIYKHNGDGTTLGEATASCNLSPAKRR